MSNINSIEEKLDKIIELLERIANPPIIIPSMWELDDDEMLCLSTNGGKLTYTGNSETKS